MSTYNSGIGGGRRRGREAFWQRDGAVVNLGLSDCKLHAFSIFANRRIHLEKSRRSELQRSPEDGTGKGEKLDKMEAVCDP